MKSRLILISVWMVLAVQISFGQQQGRRSASPFIISGKVMDGSIDKPMEYATVALLNWQDSSLVGGIASDIEGNFRVEAKQPGKYILRVGFIGFERIYKDISIASDNRQFNVGIIQIKPTAENLEEVTVVANEHSVEYRIDKKVVHVAEQYTAISGTAVDILENVPSIQVDIEGNVSLRGNSNFTVLIDDRPTVLAANDALQQIPAGMIQDIEIITNPSAKYDPEGTGGIINIVTKKRRLEGISGIVHLDAGLDDKYGGDFLLNYRNEHFNLFVGGDYNDRTYPGFILEEKRSYGPDTTFYLTSDGNRQRGRESFGARAGFEWFPDDNNTLTVSGRYGTRGGKGLSNTTYEEWNSFSNGRSIYSSDESGERTGEFFALNTEYTRKFSSRDHKMDIQLMLYQRNGDEYSVNTLLNGDNEIRTGQKSFEGGPAFGMRYRANYMQPFSKEFNIEVGAQGRLGDSEEWNEMYYYNNTSSSYLLQPQFSHTSFYANSTHAGYALMKGELDNLGYQFGFRGEYTYRDIKLEGSDEKFNIDRWDYFPTMHFSYQLPDNHQLMASYSRRIDRPRGWYLEPFYTWSDAYNIRRGNPGLQPEYINSYEVGYQKEFNRNSLSMELYYRSTRNRIERVRSLYDENIMLHSYDNIGIDYALGTELMINLTPVKWWETSLTGNFYDYRVKGQLNDVDFDRHSFTWSTRWSHIFNIAKNTRLQLNPSYRSPEIEAQEKEEGFFYVHGAIRQSFMDNNLNLTLQVRDVFGTGKHESVIDGVDFYNYRLYEHKAPMVMLNFTWRINNYRNGNRSDRGGGDGMDMDMEGEGME